MLNTFYKLTNLIIIFSSVITGWTSILLLSNSTYNSEIKELINKMYFNQKNFVLNVKDLSSLLVKDANQRFFEKNQFINQLNNEDK